MWAPDTNAAAASLGVNVLIDYSGSASELGLSQASDGRYWQLVRSRPGAPLDAPLPNEIGVDWVDEPVGHNVTAGQLTATPQDGRLNYENFATQVGGLVVGNEKDAALYRPYVSNLGSHAAISFDDYIDNDHPRDGMARLYDYVVGEREITDPRTPVGAYVESVNFEPGSRPLTPAMVIDEARTAIAGGATIINWWDYDDALDPGQTPLPTAAAIRAFTHCVHRLAPILLSKQLESFASPQDDPIKIGVHSRSIGGLQVYDAVIVNTTAVPLTITRTLPGLAGQVARNVLTGSRLSVCDTRLTVKLNGYGWAIAEFSSTPSDRSQQCNASA